MTGGAHASVAPRPVLALRALGLGDALAGVAALRGARRAWPRHPLVLAAPAPVGTFLAARGVVDGVVPAEGRSHEALAALRLPSRERPEVGLNLHGRGPESLRVLMTTEPDRLVAFDCPEVGHAGPRWEPDEHEVLRWCRLLVDAGGHCGPEDLRLADPPARRAGTAVVHPGAAAVARRWPADRWAAVAARLAQEGLEVVVTGSEAEAQLCEQVAQQGRRLLEAGPRPARGTVESAAGRLDLEQLAAVVGRTRILVSGDTGVAHLATALGTPSVTLFGPVPPSAWGPAIDLERHSVIWHGDAPGDPHGSALDPALERITTHEVVEACARLLAA